MKRPQTLKDGDVTVYKWAYVEAAILANKSPLMDREANRFGQKLIREARRPKNIRTGAFSKSWNIARVRRDMMSDRFIFTNDPGAIPINYGKSGQTGKFVFEAVVNAAIESGKNIK